MEPEYHGDELKDAYLVQQCPRYKTSRLHPATYGVTTGNIITPAVVVYLEDSTNNIVTSDDSSVTLTLSSGTLGGTTTVAAVNGKATLPSDRGHRRDIHP